MARIDNGKIKGMTRRPVNDQKCTSNKDENFIAQANEVLESDAAGLDPNSELYKNALNQLNESITRGSTIRLEIPEGYCGYQDPNTGKFIVVDDENYLRFSGGVVPTTIAPGNSATTTLSISGYPMDRCLIKGPPGSVGYMKCQENDLDQEAEEYARVTEPGLTPEVYKRWDKAYKTKLWLAMLRNQTLAFRNIDSGTSCVTNELLVNRLNQAIDWVATGDWDSGAAAFKAWEDSIQNCCIPSLHVFMAPNPDYPVDKVMPTAENHCAGVLGGGGAVVGIGKPYYKTATTLAGLNDVAETGAGVQIVARPSIAVDSINNPHFVADAGSAILRYDGAGSETVIAEGIRGSFPYNASRLYIPHIEIAGSVGWVSCKVGIKEWGDNISYGAGLWRVDDVTAWSGQTYQCHSSVYKNAGGIFIKGYGNVSIDTTDGLNKGVILGNEGTGGANGAWARYTNAAVPTSREAIGTLGNVVYRSGEKSRFRISNSSTNTGIYHAAMNGWTKNPSTYAFSLDKGVTWSGFNWASIKKFPDQGRDENHPDMCVDKADGRICYMGAYFASPGGLYINVYNPTITAGDLIFGNNCSYIDSQATRFDRFGPQWAPKRAVDGGGAYLCWTRGNDIIIAEVSQSGIVSNETVVAQGKQGAIAVDNNGSLHLTYVRPD